MIQFTTVTPSLPMRIRDVDNNWLFVLAIHSYFDDLISGDDDDTHSVYATEYGLLSTNETIGTEYYLDGEWVQI
jgi:hypothetical protein